MYPFWLRGRHHPYCGYPTFGATCSDDPMGAMPPSLDESYHRLLDICYGDRSVVAFHADLISSSYSGADPCCATRYNMSTSPVLSPFTVSPSNWALFFRANCSWALPPPTGALPLDCLGAALTGQTTETTGCKYSVVPVLPGPELRTWDDYAGIVRCGFLLEWTVQRAT
ncbi:hypothetical protein ACQ4PT_011248 [Festuca glaucescens]